VRGRISPGGQNFAEQFVISDLILITGMDIYTRPDFPRVGQPVTIRIRADSSGTPGSLLAEFFETISIVDTAGAGGPNIVRAHADFTIPLDPANGTRYWIGMSGRQNDLGQLALQGPLAPADSRMFQFSGMSPQALRASATWPFAFMENKRASKSYPNRPRWRFGASARPARRSSLRFDAGGDRQEIDNNNRPVDGHRRSMTSQGLFTMVVRGNETRLTLKALHSKAQRRRAAAHAGSDGRSIIYPERVSQIDAPHGAVVQRFQR
jgi:hypothetical protein